MAKKSMIEREKKRQKLVDQYATKRAALKVIINDQSKPVEERFKASLKLAKLPRIVGVKDATGDLARVSYQRMTCGEDFCQLSGEDATAHGFNAQGGVGCISVTANVAPKLLSQMQAACAAGDYSAAIKMQDKLMPLHQAIFTEPGLVGVKYAMSRLDLCSDEVRLPLTGLLDETKAMIDNGLRHAGLLT